MSHFRKYGFQRVVRRNNQQYLVFANDIDYRTREKSAVKLNEQLFWEKLTTIYVDDALSDNDRDALASCRTATLAFYSMAFQLAHWRRDMRTALVRAVSGSVQNARVALDEARTAFGQFNRKAGYWRGAHKHRSNVAAVAARTELGSIVPLCEDEVAFTGKLKALLDFEAAVGYVHAVCRNAFAALVVENVDIQELDRSLRRLSSEYAALHVPQAEATRWLSRVNERPLRRRDIADRATGLIDRLMREIENRVEVGMSDLDVFYRELLHERYPLPIGKFRPGF